MHNPINPTFYYIKWVLTGLLLGKTCKYNEHPEQQYKSKLIKTIAITEGSWRKVEKSLVIMCIYKVNINGIYLFINSTWML